MRARWILNSSVRLEIRSRLRLAEPSVGWPAFANAMAAAGGGIEGDREGSLIDGTIHTAEIHWYEAHGMGVKN